MSAVAPPGFYNRGEVRYGSIGGPEYEVPQSRLYCLCIDVALCSTALQCICRVIRSSMTMKAHTYYIILDVHPWGESFPPFSPLAAPLTSSNIPCIRVVSQWRSMCMLHIASRDDQFTFPQASRRSLQCD